MGREWAGREGEVGGGVRGGRRQQDMARCNKRCVIHVAMKCV